MNSKEIPSYKNLIAKRLISNPIIVELLDPDNDYEYADDLLYTRIFPFGKIPGTAQDAKTYITIAINSSLSPATKNDIVRDVTVFIRAIAHQSCMLVPKKGGTRTDLIAAEVDEMLNESFDFGLGYVVLVSNKEYTLNADYFYREVIFRTGSLNNRRVGS